jgi:hypothetical protein
MFICSDRSYVEESVDAVRSFNDILSNGGYFLFQVENNKFPITIKTQVKNTRNHILIYREFLKVMRFIFNILEKRIIEKLKLENINPISFTSLRFAAMIAKQFHKEEIKLNVVYANFKVGSKVKKVPLILSGDFLFKVANGKLHFDLFDLAKVLKDAKFPIYINQSKKSSLVIPDKTVYTIKNKTINSIKKAYDFVMIELNDILLNLKIDVSDEIKLELTKSIEKYSKYIIAENFGELIKKTILNKNISFEKKVKKNSGEEDKIFNDIFQKISKDYNLDENMNSIFINKSLVKYFQCFINKAIVKKQKVIRCKLQVNNARNLSNVYKIPMISDNLSKDAVLSVIDKIFNKSKKVSSLIFQDVHSNKQEGKVVIDDHTILIWNKNDITDDETSEFAYALTLFNEILTEAKKSSNKKIYQHIMKNLCSVVAKYTIEKDILLEN